MEYQKKLLIDFLKFKGVQATEILSVGEMTNGAIPTEYKAEEGVYKENIPLIGITSFVYFKVKGLN